MSRVQFLLSVIAVVAGLAVTVLSVILMAVFLLPWEPILFWMGVALLVGIVLIVVLASFDTLEPDVMIALTFFGDVIQIHSPLEGGKRGILNSGLVLVFPPGIVQAHRLPTEAWDIRYRTVGGFTQDTPEEPSVPCIVDLKLTFQLTHDKRGITKMLQAFPLLDEYDLTEPTEMDDKTRDPATEGAESVKYNPPCIAQKIAEVSQGVLDEAVSRILGKHKWSDARSNQRTLEEELKEELGRSTVFSTSEMLDRNGNPGRALALFDPNIALIRPVSEEAMEATSAEFKEKHLANAAKARGIGRGDEIKETAERGRVTGREALASQTIKDAPNLDLTIVNAESLLEGAMGQVLSGKKPSKGGNKP